MSSTVAQSVGVDISKDTLTGDHGSPLARVFLSASATLVGAAMCPACFVRHIEPLAIMPSAYQVPTKSSHSRCWVDMGSPDPAVSTGLLHQLPSALPNFVSATAVAPCFL